MIPLFLSALAETKANFFLAVVVDFLEKHDLEMKTVRTLQICNNKGLTEAGDTGPWLVFKCERCQAHTYLNFLVYIF